MRDIWFSRGVWDSCFLPRHSLWKNAKSLTPLRHLHGSSAGKEKPESICLLSGSLSLGFHFVCDVICDGLCRNFVAVAFQKTFQIT